MNCTLDMLVLNDEQVCGRDLLWEIARCVVILSGGNFMRVFVTLDLDCSLAVVRHFTPHQVDPSSVAASRMTRPPPEGAHLD